MSGKEPADALSARCVTLTERETQSARCGTLSTQSARCGTLATDAARAAAGREMT